MTQPTVYVTHRCINETETTLELGEPCEFCHKKAINLEVIKVEREGDEK